MSKHISKAEMNEVLNVLKKDPEYQKASQTIRDLTAKELKKRGFDGDLDAISGGAVTVDWVVL